MHGRLVCLESDILKSDSCVMYSVVTPYNVSGIALPVAVENATGSEGPGGVVDGVELLARNNRREKLMLLLYNIYE